MIKLLKIKPASGRALSSVLGLSLEGSRLEGVVLRRTNGSLQVQQTFSVALSLDPLTADAELVGREIRNHLDSAEVRERHCVVSLPIKWALTSVVDVPELPDENIAEFLQLEAERGFHADVSTLHFAASVARFPSGKRQALLVGVPRTHLKALEDGLKAAKLKPVSFGVGIAEMGAGKKEASIGVLSVSISDIQAGLMVSGGGGIVALRALEGALEVEGGKRVLHAEAMAREIRITLGQLPAELRDTIKKAQVFGAREMAQQLADELDLRLEPLGLKTEVVSRYPQEAFGLQLPVDTAVGPAVSMAARRLAGWPAVFELLPPRVSPWQQAVARYSSGKMQMAGAAAGILLLGVLGAFGFQQWQLSKYDGQWRAMAPKVKELEGVSEQIHKYRPWYDDSMKALLILEQLTKAFPEDGSVSAKTIEIRDLNTVTCTGTTKDRAGVIKVFEGLRAMPDVSEAGKVNIRGNKPPLQFTFDFRWAKGGKSDN